MNEKYKNLDLEKIKGRYVHYGHVIRDIQENASATIDSFFAEIYQLLEGLLADQLEKSENFTTAKEILLEYLLLISTAFGEITIEKMKEKFEAIKEANDINWEEVKKLFGKNGVNYIT